MPEQHDEVGTRRAELASASRGRRAPKPDRPFPSARLGEYQHNSRTAVVAAHQLGAEGWARSSRWVRPGTDRRCRRPPRPSRLGRSALAVCPAAFLGQAARPPVRPPIRMGRASPAGSAAVAMGEGTLVSAERLLQSRLESAILRGQGLLPMPHARAADPSDRAAGRPRPRTASTAASDSRRPTSAPSMMIASVTTSPSKAKSRAEVTQDPPGDRGGRAAGIEAWVGHVRRHHRGDPAAIATEKGTRSTVSQHGLARGHHRPRDMRVDRRATVARKVLHARQRPGALAACDP